MARTAEGIHTRGNYSVNILTYGSYERCIFSWESANFQNVLVCVYQEIVDWLFGFYVKK